jgi:hypothetical protein
MWFNETIEEPLQQVSVFKKCLIFFDNSNHLLLIANAYC